MFYNSLKKDAIAVYDNEAKKYKIAYDEMIHSCEILFGRREKAIKLIKDIEWLINSIANTPKEFSTMLGDVRKEMDEFSQTQQFIDEDKRETIKSSISIGSGVLGGAAVASMAPSVAMSIATTFGTASTGTAISALSGAAAQKAALAWLGGGPVIVGGGGVAAGQALLALAGPVGWSITAVTTGVSVAVRANKNKKIANKAISEAKNVAIMRNAVKSCNVEIQNLSNETTLLYDKLHSENAELRDYSGADYMTLNEDIRIRLGALVNHTLAMSKLINKTVGEEENAD